MSRESELSQVSKFGILVESVLSIKKSKVLSRVRVESPGLSHESESSQPEQYESSTTLVIASRIENANFLL